MKPQFSPGKTFPLTEEKEEGDKKEKHPALKINSNHCTSIQYTEEDMAHEGTLVLRET